MSAEGDEIHDLSRVDAFMAARRRSMLMHAVWKPMLAGAAGAALVIACVWVVLPKVSYREIEVPKVTMRDTPVPNIVPRDVPVDRIAPHDVQVDHVVPRDVAVPNIVLVPKDVQVDHVVPHNVEIDIPRIVTAPAPPAFAPPTPIEQRFIDSDAYQSTEYHGRIVKSVDGVALSFDNGRNFYPAHLDAASRPVLDREHAFASDEFVGEFGMCRQDPADYLWNCVALSRDGVEIPIAYKRRRAT